MPFFFFESSLIGRKVLFKTKQNIISVAISAGIFFCKNKKLTVGAF